MRVQVERVLSALTESDIEERYDIQVDSEREMVADNLDKLEEERIILETAINEIREAMPGQSKARYEELEQDYEDALYDLNNINRAIKYHHDLQEQLIDMNEMMDALKTGSLPEKIIISTMDSINENRNRIKDEIANSGYTFW